MAEIRNPDGLYSVVTSVVFVQDAPTTQIWFDSQADGPNEWYSGPPTFGLEARDSTGTAVVTYWDMANSAGTYHSSDVFTDIIAIPGDGTWTISYRSINGYGFAEATQIWVMHVDSLAPTLEITSPIDGSYDADGSVTIDGSGDGTGSALSYEIDYGNGYEAAVLPWTHVFADGAYAISVKALDQAGNYYITTVSVIVDTISPVVTITAPLNGAYYKSTDLPIGVFSVDDPDADLVDSGWSIVEGVHTYTVTATDAAGNVGSASVTYTIDDTAPIVSITAPLNGANYETTMVPTGVFTISETYLGSTFESGWSNYVGEHTYTVRAVDKAGNEGMYSVTYIVHSPIQYTLSINAIGGSVIKDPDQSSYANGQSVTLTEIPDLGWSFLAWGGEASGTGTSITVIMDGDKAITAIFIQNVYTLTIDKVGNGQVTADPLGPYHYDDVVTLTPIADPGWTFSGWSDNAIAGVVTMNSDKTVTATFTQNGQGSISSISYTGDSIVLLSSSSINLRATIIGDGIISWNDVKVTFCIYRSSTSGFGALVRTIGPMDASGTYDPGIGVVEASTSLPLEANQVEAEYLVIVSYAGVAGSGEGTPVVLTLVSPTGDFITGGGWIWDSPDQKGSFGFVIRYDKYCKPSGSFTYVYEKEGMSYIVKATSITGLSFDMKPPGSGLPAMSHALFEGKCTVQRYDPSSGQMITLSGIYKFRVDAWDGSDVVGPEVLRITVSDPIGATFHQAGFGESPFNGYLQGGNVQVHRMKK